MPAAAAACPTCARSSGGRCPTAGCRPARSACASRARCRPTASPAPRSAPSSRTPAAICASAPQKTDADGRAMFEGMAPGDEFHAEVTVDGETLKTQTFTDAAGGRHAHHADRRARRGGGEAARRGGEAPARRPGAGGRAAVHAGRHRRRRATEPACPAGRSRSRLFDEAGAPIPNHAGACSGWSTRRNKIDVRHGKSDAAGVARFADLADAARATGYAAVIEWHGHAPRHRRRSPCRRPAARAPRSARSAAPSDPSVMTIGSGGRVIVQMREDTLQFLEMLPLENTLRQDVRSRRRAPRDPAAQGVRRRRGAGERRARSTSARTTAWPCTASSPPARRRGDNGAKNAGQRSGVRFRAPLPRRHARRSPSRCPTASGRFTLITEQHSGPHRHRARDRRARGARARRPQVLGDARASAIAPGGVLEFTLTRPAVDRLDRAATWPASLALLLIAGAVVFGRRRQGRAAAARSSSERDRLVDAPRDDCSPSWWRSSAAAREAARRRRRPTGASSWSTQARAGSTATSRALNDELGNRGPPLPRWTRRT